MTPGGWINMILSVGFVTGLFTWCMLRVRHANGRRAEHLARVEPIERDELDER